jgi:GT2 family glycosyltransferase
VNYNTGSVLKDCLDSLYKIEESDFFEVIVVDNNSSDNSKDIIESYKSAKNNFKGLYLDKLESFSFANNRGFEFSSGEYTLILNPDIIFTEPVLEQLVNDLNSNKIIGAISLMLRGTDGKFQSNYFQRYPSLLQFVMFYSVFMRLFAWSAFLTNKFLENNDIEKSEDEIFYVPQIPGAFFLTTRKIFNEVGMMDEDYKLFYEDVELSYRINKRYKLAVDTRLSIIHLGGSSFQTDENWWQYSRYIMSLNLFFDKNYNIIRRFFLKLFSVSNSIIALTLEWIKKLLGKQNEYRYKKHLNFLKDFFNYYF